MVCHFCSDIVKDSVKRLKINDSGMINKQTAAIFDCRGLEPIEFDPQVTLSLNSFIFIQYSPV